MNKRKLHHIWTIVRPIKPIYFLIVAGVLALTCVLSLRQNNLNMIKLRDKVYAADQQNGDTETALRHLREYVYTHMHTDLSSGGNSIKPPIQLKYRYDRLVAAAQAQSANQTSKVYSDAQAECERQFPVGLSGSGRIPCIQAYVYSHGPSQVSIPDALYKFDFVSPRWTPDLAGLSLVGAVMFGLIGSVMFIADWWFKTATRD
jgi:hypothetical protein